MPLPVRLCCGFHAVLSDMAHNFMGVASADHLKQISLAWDAYRFALTVRERSTVVVDMVIFGT